MHSLIHQPSSNSYDSAKINFHQIYLKDVMTDNMAALGGHYKHLTLFIWHNQKKVLRQNLQAIYGLSGQPMFA